MHYEPIPLVAPLMDDADKECMHAAVRRGAVAEGQLTRAFEEQFRKLLGVAGAMATNSGTSALVLALAALEVGPDDEIILPSYTCLALLNAVAQLGAVPRLVDNVRDVPRMDYNLDVQQVRATLSPRTRAILVPHMFGVPADVDALAQLGVPVIEDITLSLGGTHAGRPVGSRGLMSVCSFHASKMITSGEGGMIACRDAATFAKVHYLNGWEAEQAALRTRDDGFGEYSVRYNFRLSDVAAALGLSQLDKLPSFIARRRALAERYTARLQAIPGVITPSAADPHNIFYRYLVACENRDIPTLIRRFAAAGIEAGRGVYPPLHRYLGLDAARFPTAEKCARTMLSIPLYPALGDEQVERVLCTSAEVLAA